MPRQTAIDGVVKYLKSADIAHGRKEEDGRPQTLTIYT